MTPQAPHAAPSLRRLYASFDRWLHAPADLALCSVIRIGLGALVAINFLAAAPYVTLYWSEDGVLPRAAAKMFRSQHALSLLDVLPTDTNVLWAAWTVALLQALLLAAGLWARLQAASVFVWLVSFNMRNTLILDGEDTVFRLFTFMLIFMPMSEVWSLDAWRRRKRGSIAPAARDGWALRLMQLQVCLVVWSAGLEKLSGKAWWNGTAMHYVLHLDDLATRFPVPDLLRESRWMVAAMTYGALWIELFAPILVWFRETRRGALLALFGLHLGIDYMMNLFLFQPLMLVGWLSHAQRSDVAWLRGLGRKLRGAKEEQPELRHQPTRAA